MDSEGPPALPVTLGPPAPGTDGIFNPTRSSIRQDQREGSLVPRVKTPFSKLEPEYVEELWARIGEHARMEGDCTVYDRHHSSNGYGRISVKGVLVPVHRFVYERAYGEQELGTEIDHLCHNRVCIRLAHLEAVDRAENARRRRSHGFHETGGTRSKRWCR